MSLAVRDHIFIRIVFFPFFCSIDEQENAAGANVALLPIPVHVPEQPQLEESDVNTDSAPLMPIPVHVAEQSQLNENDVDGDQLMPIPISLGERSQLEKNVVNADSAQQMPNPVRFVMQSQLAEDNAHNVANANSKAASVVSIKIKKRKREKVDDSAVRIWPFGKFKGKQMCK